MIRIILIAVLFLIGQQKLTGQTAHKQLRSGDRAYKQENYTEAQQDYQAASRQNPASLSAIYNLGCAEYQQGKFPEAEKSFEQAASGDQQPNNKADVLYNLGNARLKQRKYNDAIVAYEQSLRLRPGDAAAKQNLQLAKHKLQEQKQQEQKKQQTQKQNETPSAPNDQSPPEQPQPAGKENQPPNPPEQNSGEQPQPGPEQQPAAGTAGKMSRQEAQRLLESTIGPEDRKSARKYRANVQRESAPKANKKDW